MLASLRVSPAQGRGLPWPRAVTPEARLHRGSTSGETSLLVAQPPPRPGGWLHPPWSTLPGHSAQGLVAWTLSGVRDARHSAPLEEGTEQDRYCKYFDLEGGEWRAESRITSQYGLIGLRSCHDGAPGTSLCSYLKQPKTQTKYNDNTMVFKIQGQWSLRRETKGVDPITAQVTALRESGPGTGRGTGNPRNPLSEDTGLKGEGGRTGT